MKRIRAAAGAAAGWAAVAAGRLVGGLARGLPGVAGPLLVAYGLWLAWVPLGFIAGGVLLLAVDRRVP